MSDFPEPGPRRVVTDQDRRDALAAHVSRARPRASSPTPPPSPVPPINVAFAVDPELASTAAGRRRVARVVEDALEFETENPVAIGVMEDMLAFESEDAAVGWRDHSSELPALSSEPRKSRQHANSNGDREERRFDTTALHFDKHGRLMSHADYIAHCERWDYAWRSIETGDRILDVGCGEDTPFMRAINFVQGQAAKVLPRVGGCYVGVDLNKLRPTGIAWATLLGETDVTSDEGYQACLEAIPGNEEALANGVDEDLRGYSLVVCFEVVEHMPPQDGKRLLQNIHDLLSEDGRALLSTPVYDGKGQARNHIHEWFIPELQEVIESVGLVVARRMGTFASEPVIKKWMRENRPDWLALYMESRQFHSSGYMSGLIAPMVPDLSRNNIWELRRGPA